MSAPRQEIDDFDGDGWVFRVAVQHFEYGPPVLLLEIDSGSHVSGFTLTPGELDQAIVALGDARAPLTAAIAGWDADQRATRLGKAAR